MAGEEIMTDGTGEKIKELDSVKVGNTPVDLFDAESASQESAVFTVGNDGSGVLLSAFGNCCDLIVMKVKTNVQDMPHEEGKCCHASATSFLAPNNITHEDTVDQGCGNWALTTEGNTGVITVPGCYQVFLCDETCLTEFSLCAQKISAAAINNIPRQMISGYTQ